MIHSKNTGQAQLLAIRLFNLIILILASYYLQSIILPLLFAGMLTFLLLPLNNKLEALKTPRSLSIIICLLVFIAILFTIIFLAVRQITDLEELLPLLQQKVEVLLKNANTFFFKTFNIRLNSNKTLIEAQNILKEGMGNISKILSNTVVNVSSLIAQIILIPLYTFMFLYYRNHFEKFLYKLFSNQNPKKISALIDQIKDLMVSYFSGVFMVIGIIGILNTLFLLILGISHAIFFGFFAAVLALIPLIGIAMGSLLPFLVALITKDSYWYAVGVIVSFQVVQFLEGNFITPNIVGSKISINAFVAIIAFLLFGALWGIAGFVLALPLTAVIKVILEYSSSYKVWAYLLGEEHSK